VKTPSPGFGALYKIDSWDYRPFLKQAIEIMRAESPRKLSYSALARLFGFRSKSFLQHVLNGERHLSIESAERVAEGLRLRDRERSIFLSLVRLNALDTRENASDLDKATRLRKALTRARVKRHAVFKSMDNSQHRHSLFADPRAMVVYAGLGSGKRGATLEEIAERTGLSKPSVKTSLERLVAGGVAARDLRDADPRYKTEEPFVFDRSEEGRELVRRLYVDFAKDALKKAEADFTHPDRLFITYALSLDSRRLPELHARLKKTITEFVVEAEESEGDRVLRLSIGLC
jgi:uncharacterized protein (TIGR02147 family)